MLLCLYIRFRENLFECNRRWTHHTPALHYISLHTTQHSITHHTSQQYTDQHRPTQCLHTTLHHTAPHRPTQCLHTTQPHTGPTHHTKPLPTMPRKRQRLTFYFPQKLTNRFVPPTIPIIGVPIHMTQCGPLTRVCSCLCGFECKRVIDACYLFCIFFYA